MQELEQKAKGKPGKFVMNGFWVFGWGALSVYYRCIEVCEPTRQHIGIIPEVAGSRAADAAASEVFVEMSETHSNTTVCMAALCFSPTSLVAWRFESGLLTNLQQQSHRYTHQTRRNSVICTNLFCFGCIHSRRE